jgi:hypothetical protein
VIEGRGGVLVTSRGEGDSYFAVFPPIRTVAESTGSLTVQVSSFVGRGRELERTSTALSQARVVTLTGVGGVGKTRLALHAAGQLAPRFGDNTWLCQLAPVRDASGVDDAVATIFSVTARARQSIREALVDFLRPLASEALALARQIGAPGLIATGLP